MEARVGHTYSVQIKVRAVESNPCCLGTVIWLATILMCYSITTQLTAAIAADAAFCWGRTGSHAFKTPCQHVFIFSRITSLSKSTSNHDTVNSCTRQYFKTTLFMLEKSIYSYIKHDVFTSKQPTSQNYW